MLLLFLLGLLIGVILVEVVELSSRRWISPPGEPPRPPVADLTVTHWTSLDDRQLERAVRDSCR